MKFIQSKWFHWILGSLGVGGSLFCLIYLSHWKNLVWPGTLFIIFLLFLVGFEMACRSVRLQKVCAFVGEQISFWESLWIGALGDVYGAATPSSIGGEVSRLAALARFGIKGSHAMMILAAERLVLLISLTVVMVGSGFVIFFKDASLFSLRSLLYTLVLYGALAVGLVVFLIFLIRRKKFNMSWKRLLLRPSIFLLAMVHHVVRLGFLPFILWFFAHYVPNLQILTWSFILGYGISLLPIPSGGGSVELTFLAIFKPLLGEEVAGLVLIWWRFSSHYFYVLLGIVVTFLGMIKLSNPLAKMKGTGRTSG